VDKVYASTAEAVADIPDGSSIAIAGFFTCGYPMDLIKELAKQGAKDLTIISMTMGVGAWEIDLLLQNRQVKKGIANYPFFRSTSKKTLFEEQLDAGRIELEIYPMGTFAEKLRAGGAGIGAFYTPTGVGTVVAEGKESRIIEGREHLLEFALRPDYSFIHAYRGDRMGNLQFRKTARNYNPEMGMAGKITIAEVENIVEPGEIDPEMVHLPGIYVKRMIKVEKSTIDVSIE
jgi:3-oxoacid CoA-transferase subunit A